MEGSLRVRVMQLVVEPAILPFIDGDVTMTRLFVVLFASLLAASCTIVRTNVAVTHMLPASAAKTVAIVPYTENLAMAPDYQANTQKLAAQLRSKGFNVVPQQGTADYIAYFIYRIDNGTVVNQFEGRPQPNTGSITTYGLRTAFSTSTRRIYMRSVTVEIVDRARFQPNMPATYLAARVYSGSVVSDGPCTMAVVIDPMLNALFADFPGQSGQLRAINVPADSTCGLDRFG
jgi:hypothetical protein